LSFGATSIIAANASSTLYAIDPAAQNLLSQMQTAYNALNSLSEQVTAEESPNIAHSLAVHTSIKLLRPGYLEVSSDSKSARSGAEEVVTDGSHCYVFAPQYPTRYLKYPVPATAQAVKSALSQRIASSLTIGLFIDSTTVSTMFASSRLATLHLEKSAKINGTATHAVVVTDVDGVTLTLYIGDNDHLLRRVVALDPEKSGTFTETYESVQENSSLSPSNFSFVAPPHTVPFYGTSFDQAIQDAPDK
jgi:outer membrane lipoprotein-sorting protein